MRTEFGDLGVVRFRGPVASKEGEWIGSSWTNRSA